jgi:hypothetical protein
MEPKMDEDGNVVGNLNDSRLKRMAQIADDADRVRAEEFGGEVETPPDDVQAPEVSLEPDETPRKFKLKINGREEEVDEAELIARAQKVSSADQYLKDAAEAVKNAIRLVPSPKEDEQARDEDDLALARALQMGSEEEAVQALRKIRSRPSEVTPDVVAKVVDERLSFRRAADKFKEDYGDLLSDPILKNLVYQKDAELAQSDPSLDYAERLERVGKEIRGWKEKLGGGPKVDKAVRKASVAQVPAAAGRQASLGEAEGEDDPESVIAQMAKTRGQGRPVSH